MDDTDRPTLRLKRDAMLSNYMDETFALREKVMRLTLTPDERDAISIATAEAEKANTTASLTVANVLRSLLTRTAD